MTMQSTALTRWLSESDSSLRRKYEAQLDELRLAHNGGADIHALVDSEYGAVLTERLRLTFTFEEDPTGLAVEEYYRGLGLRRQVFQNSDYYTRWLVVTPLELETEAAKGVRYPVLFVHHGGHQSISTDEFTAGFHEVAARERIILVMLQDTNWQNTERVLDRLIELFPVDTERVYLAGESQGGYQVTSAFFRFPERITAVLTCGNDIWRDWDNVNEPFTDDERRRVRDAVVPFMQINGQFEASSFAPVSDWRPRKDWGRPRELEGYRDPRRDDDRDPTRNVRGPRRFSNQPEPPAGADKNAWAVSRLNERMSSLGLAERDAATCIGYLTGADSELHRILGFYGDRERTEIIHGTRHWIADIDDAAGMNVFRYVVVENAPHAWPLAAGALGWEFLSRFRRDASTGRIVVDERQTPRTTPHNDVQETSR
ncbi:alpha/beta fold hydrolase [Curtobacterium sp. 18060]|uniref:alpha/beta fold hydrolase n=1 Tax=Curtobacterium sp. 18060 TaxID=2681408 RepID=UPI001358971C|nr:alpha/beta hydrolase [Curtobacterium sp. 18060]